MQLTGVLAAHLPGINTINSAIANSDVVDPPTGVRRTKPVNVNGVYNIFSSLNTGFPLRKLKSNISVGTSVVYARNVAFINNARNYINNLAINPNLT